MFLRINNLVCSDRSFATNKDGTSQLGHLIFMVEKYNRENLIE